MVKDIINKIRYFSPKLEVISTVDGVAADRYINDARSATFYAFGEERRDFGAILIIRGYELQSAYTAITEAWFQKANIYIIAIFDKFDEINTNFLKRCVNKTLFIENVEELGKIDDSFNDIIGPKLINVIDKSTSTNEIDYGNIVSNIKKINKNIEVIQYNGNNIEEKNICEKYKYGVLSKYLGKTAVSDKDSILLCTPEIFFLDLNIFNSRYVSDKFKIIVIDKDNLIRLKHIDKWIISNGISLYYGEDKLEQLFLNSTPGILIIGGKQ